MGKFNWKTVKFRCHSLGDIITPPKDAAKKAAGEMGATAVKRLIKIYALEKWGREEKITSDPILKGLLQEELGIELINRLEGETFVKNEERVENEYFSGIPDFYKGKEIRKSKLIGDNKCSYTAPSFLENEIAELKKMYDAQMQGYCDLGNCEKAAVYFTLVNAPLSIILKHQSRIKWEMGIIDEAVSAEYREAAAEIEFNMTFNDIPEKERLIKIEVVADNEKITQMHKAVERGREWLAEFDEKRMSRYK